MSNRLSKLWFNIRKALGCNASAPAAEYSVQGPEVHIPPTLHQAELFENASVSATKPTKRRKTTALKRQQYPFLDKRMAQITGKGTYFLGPQGRMDVYKLQRLVGTRLYHRFGKGAYTTHIDRAANRLEVVIF